MKTRTKLCFAGLAVLAQMAVAAADDDQQCQNGQCSMSTPCQNTTPTLQTPSGPVPHPTYCQTKKDKLTCMCEVSCGGEYYWFVPIWDADTPQGPMTGGSCKCNEGEGDPPPI